MTEYRYLYNCKQLIVSYHVLNLILVRWFLFKANNARLIIRLVWRLLTCILSLPEKLDLSSLKWKIIQNNWREKILESSNTLIKHKVFIDTNKMFHNLTSARQIRLIEWKFLVRNTEFLPGHSTYGFDAKSQLCPGPSNITFFGR